MVMGVRLPDVAGTPSDGNKPWDVPHSVVPGGNARTGVEYLGGTVRPRTCSHTLGAHLTTPQGHRPDASPHLCLLGQARQEVCTT